MKKKWNFHFNESLISNMINDWKKSSNRFDKYLFLDNIYNWRNERYLKNYTNTISYNTLN